VIEKYWATVNWMSSSVIMNQEMCDARHCGWVHEYCVTPSYLSSYGEVHGINKFWVAVEKLGRNIFEFGKCKFSSCLYIKSWELYVSIA
jgi:hypothetical protein